MGPYLRGDESRWPCYPYSAAVRETLSACPTTQAPPLGPVLGAWTPGQLSGSLERRSVACYTGVCIISVWINSHHKVPRYSAPFAWPSDFLRGGVGAAMALVGTGR